jgi:competence ComEA-like helix-hairpin-helix protein
MSAVGGDRRAARSTALLVLLLSGVVVLRVLASGAGARSPLAPVACRLDPSTASVHELSMLPGVGPSLARAIVLDRAEHGAFPSIDALTRVKGIGPARLAALKPWLRSGGEG